MLNTTIPTLEIKTTEIDLSTIETMYITIKQGDFQAVKSNNDIEVDNDIISLSLTQNEISQFKGMDGIVITILAITYDGRTDNVKIGWVKRGSRTSYIASGGSDGSASSSNEIWYPTVLESGTITWEKSASETPPIPRNIKGAKGDDGITPHIGDNGNWHIGFVDTGIAAKGTDGFSPSITENPENTSTIYKLDITTKDGTITTPNLKGKDGNISGGGGSSGSGGLFTFEIREDGHLWIISDSETQAQNFRINEDGHLIYTLEV